MEPETKQCVKCGFVKPLTEFHKASPNRKAERAVKCAQCSSKDPVLYGLNKNGLKVCRSCGQVKPRCAFPVAYKSAKRQTNILRAVCAVCSPPVPCLTYGKTNRYRIEGDTAYIELTNRQDVTIAEAIIDAADLADVLARGRWCAHRTPHTTYVQRSYWNGKRGTKEELHRFIMQPPAHLCVDHKNGNALDNRRANLRVVTQSENCRNKRCHRERAQSKKGEHIPPQGV